MPKNKQKPFSLLPGWGAVFNTVKMEPEKSVVVFGLGALGLSVIQAAKMVCALLGKVETIEVTETCDLLISQCVQFDQVTAHISRDAKSLIQMSLTLKSFNQTFLN